MLINHAHGGTIGASFFCLFSRVTARILESVPRPLFLLYFLFMLSTLSVKPVDADGGNINSRDAESGSWGERSAKQNGNTPIQCIGESKLAGEHEFREGGLP